MGRKRKTTDVISLVSQCHSSPPRSQKQITIIWFPFFCYSWKKFLSPIVVHFDPDVLGMTWPLMGREKRNWIQQYMFPYRVNIPINHLLPYKLWHSYLLIFVLQSNTCSPPLFVSLPSLISPNSTAVVDQRLAFPLANHFCPPSSRLHFLCLNVPISLSLLFRSCFHSPF